MGDLDPIDERVRDGLARTERELEALAERLSGGPEAMPETPADLLNSDTARDAGYAIASALGEGLRALIFANRLPRIPSVRRPWRFISPIPTPAVAAAPPPSPAATAPPAALLSGPQSEPPKASGTLNTQMSFVGFLDDRPRAAGSSRFPTEPFAAHERRLDIDHRTPIPRFKELKGPIVGGIIPSE